MYSLRTAAMLLGCIMGALVVVLVVVTFPAWAGDVGPRYYDEQLLNYRYTEICSIKLPKNDALPKALEEAYKIDSTTWEPWLLWWNEVMDKYQKGKCGNA